MIALQLGALRDARIEAGAPIEKATAASEEVAGYESRLTRLTTMVQAMLGIGMVLLASQGGVWFEIGRLNASTAQLSAKVTQMDAKFDAKFSQVDARLSQLEARMVQTDVRMAQMEATLAQIAAAVLPKATK